MSAGGLSFATAGGSTTSIFGTVVSMVNVKSRGTFPARSTPRAARCGPIGPAVSRAGPVQRRSQATRSIERFAVAGEDGSPDRRVRDGDVHVMRSDATAGDRLREASAADLVDVKGPTLGPLPPRSAISP